MTIPAILWMHDGISERETAHTWPNGMRDDAKWEDCTYDSALMWYRQVHDPSVPSTHYEAERLRQDSGEGPLGGTNPFDVRRGLLARYHWVAPPPITGWPALRLALGPGHAAVATGLMGAFPDGHRLRRFQPNFAGAHAVNAVRPDLTLRYWVSNPLAAEDHDGEWWTEDELRRYVQAGGGSFYHLVGKVLPKPPTKPERVRVSGSYWDYDIRVSSSGTGVTVLGRKSKRTSGFSADLARQGYDKSWEGLKRRFQQINDPHSAYNQKWLDVLDEPNVRLIQ